MGRPKLLLPHAGATVLEHLLAVWQSSRVDRIVVVAHTDDGEVHACCRRMGVELVVPATPPPEMKVSVAAALAYIAEEFSPTSCDAWLLAPADMPRLSREVIDRLLAEHAARADQPCILAPSHGGKRGHPVLFPWPLAAEVDDLADEEGVNAIVQRHKVRELACDDAGVLADLDTPEDYRRLRDG
jgi:molybdenum cofactor cytidylyltransferase